MHGGVTYQFISTIKPTFPFQQINCRSCKESIARRTKVCQQRTRGEMNRGGIAGSSSCRSYGTQISLEILETARVDCDFVNLVYSIAIDTRVHSDSFHFRVTPRGICQRLTSSWLIFLSTMKSERPKVQGPGISAYSYRYTFKCRMELARTPATGPAL